MANITQLYKTPPHGDGEMDEYKKKLFRHRAGLGIRFLTAAVVAAVIVLGVWIWSRNRTYTDKFGQYTVCGIQWTPSQIQPGWNLMC